MDTLSPWLVGRFADNKGFDNIFKSVIVPDSVQTGTNGQGYAPNVWPGFSWYNLQNGASPLNDIPRNGGDFWQHQFDAFTQALPNRPLFIYGAMFDEFDEGTAMAKAAPNADALPSEGVFLHLSADGIDLPSDFYLRLAGDNTVQYRADANTNANKLRQMDGPPSHFEHDESAMREQKRTAAVMASMQRESKITRLLAARR
jgi:glycoprotein endo-alpha-1,2-mannosidase